MTTYFVLGASRGIGLSLVKILAKDKSNLVIASVRTQKAANVLTSLGYDNLKIIFIDLASSYGEFEKEFKKFDQLAPNGIDVFIQNGGVEGPNFFPPAHQYDVDEYGDVFAVNVAGAAKAYKAVYPYLFKGTGQKKIIITSSIAGSTGGLLIGANAYGASKAAVNHLGVQIAKENQSSDIDLVKNSTTILLHPGFVDTEMAIEAKKHFPPEGFIPADQSASGIIQVISKLTSEDTGKFLDNEGNEVPF